MRDYPPLTLLALHPNYGPWLCFLMCPELWGGVLLAVELLCVSPRYSNLLEVNWALTIENRASRRRANNASTQVADEGGTKH